MNNIQISQNKNSNNHYILTHLNSNAKNKFSHSKKNENYKNKIIINNTNIINNNFDNLLSNSNNHENNNQCQQNNIHNNNLISLTGINISYSELARHLHSRKSTANNTRAKNSKETSMEKTHSSIGKIYKQSSHYKIVSTQTDKEKESEKEKEACENFLLTQETQDFFINNSFKKKNKRNSCLKYNNSNNFNNISQIFKNSSSNLYTSNSNSNINIPNLVGSYSFVNNGKTTKDNSMFTNLNSLKASNYFNIPTMNNSTNVSYNNLNNQHSNNINLGYLNNNRNNNCRNNATKDNNHILNYNDSAKNLMKTNNQNDIEGPEILHCFYVNILQQNKKLAFKFENCEEEIISSFNEGDNSNTFAL